MTQEAKRPSNPDYTASAVKLTNSPEVKALLDEWVAAEKLDEEATRVSLLAIGDLPETIASLEARNQKVQARENLEVAVKELGGYQDVEQGLYALQQVRKTVTYDPEKVKVEIPTYADKILAQVDVAVLKGLLRGKLITQEQVDACATVKESLRFVIEAVR